VRQLTLSFAETRYSLRGTRSLVLARVVGGVLPPQSPGDLRSVTR
jgi:hypothetical protein